jgi:hypothetical protein
VRHNNAKYFNRQHRYELTCTAGGVQYTTPRAIYAAIFDNKTNEDSSVPSPVYQEQIQMVSAATDKPTLSSIGGGSGVD